MLTRDEFDQWFTDYKSRWPSVSDYAARQQLPGALLDNWHASMAAFDLETLEAVTAGIVAGEFEPVENVKLGVFASEIRRMAREVWHRRREAEDRRKQKTAGKAKPFTPLISGSMQDMYHACCAVYELAPGCDQDVIDAAIALADDHTQAEADRAVLALEGAGLTWEQVLEVAGRLKRTGGRPMVPSAKGLESEVA